MTNPSFLERGYCVQHLLPGRSRKKVFQTLSFDDGTCVACILNSRKVEYRHMNIKGPKNRALRKKKW